LQAGNLRGLEKASAVFVIGLLRRISRVSPASSMVVGTRNIKDVEYYLEDLKVKN
jgi:hypothetical protein